MENSDPRDSSDSESLYPDDISIGSSPLRESLDSPQRTNDDNEPPFSRLFINTFQNVGLLSTRLHPGIFLTGRYCKILRDKFTGESKGVAYIKYYKSSSAALAIETYHLKPIVDRLPPFKVLIAESKTKKASPQQILNKDPEDTPPRSRLFVICSKEINENNLVSIFQVFGNLEYCKLMKDKYTGDSKGCAYVKYSKASTAAVAMETINEQHRDDNAIFKLKVLIADPKKTMKVELPRHAPMSPPQEIYYHPVILAPMTFPFIPAMENYPVPYMPYPPPAPYMYPAPYPAVSPQIPKQRLFVVCPKTITQTDLENLFGSVGGMEYCDLKRDKKTTESKGFAYINYTSVQCALMAKEQFDGYEIAPGHNLKVLFADPKVAPMATPMPAPIIYGSPYPSHGNITYLQPPHTPPYYDQVDESKLLLVFQGKPLAEYTVGEVFSQFTGLEYVRINKEKNYGYIKFSSGLAAQYAMNMMNGAEINGTTIKLSVVAPASSTVPDFSRKRQKT